MLVKKLLLLALALGGLLTNGSNSVEKESTSYTQLAIRENIETTPPTTLYMP